MLFVPASTIGQIPHHTKPQDRTLAELLLITPPLGHMEESAGPIDAGTAQSQLQRPPPRACTRLVRLRPKTALDPVRLSLHSDFFTPAAVLQLEARAQEQTDEV